MSDIDRELVVRMRGILLSVTHCLQEILEDGLPKPPARKGSMQDRMDSQSAHQEWHECRWQMIRDADEVLKDTESFARFMTISRKDRLP